MRSDAVAAGDAARTARVKTEVTQDGDLRLIPDAEGSTPTPQPFRSSFTGLVGRPVEVGLRNQQQLHQHRLLSGAGGSEPRGPLLRRSVCSYFEFPTTNGKVSLKKKHIHDAYVQMTLYHSYGAWFLSGWGFGAVGGVGEEPCMPEPLGPPVGWERGSRGVVFGWKPGIRRRRTWSGGGVRARPRGMRTWVQGWRVRTRRW